MGAAAAKRTAVSLRNETKYTINEAVRVSLLHDLRLLMEPDPHSRGSQQGYTVESLYFDTPDWANYYQKLDGLAQRIKFRIRQYDGNAQTRRLEAKEKIVDRVRKRQVGIDSETYHALIHGLLPTPGDETVDRFVFERSRSGLRPCVIAGYRRMALVARSDPGLRVTIDTDLRAQYATNFEVRESCAGPVLPRGHSILELKWRDGFPFWFHALVQKYNLRNAPLSKYVLAVDAATRRGSLPRA